MLRQENAQTRSLPVEGNSTPAKGLAEVVSGDEQKERPGKCSGTPRPGSRAPLKPAGVCPPNSSPCSQIYFAFFR